MTTETEQRDELFERYSQRHLPLYLAGSSPPPDYPATAKEWATDRAVVVSELRRKWAAKLAQGWTPAELANGPSYGTEVHADGSPMRKMERELPAEVSREARRLLQAAADRSIRLDAVDEVKLERAAAGLGHAQSVEDTLQGVAAQIRTHDYKAQATKIESDSRPLVTFFCSFRGPRGSQFAPGTMQVDPELALELREWARKVEVQAAQGERGFAAIGYPQWPTFELETRPADQWQGA